MKSLILILGLLIGLIAGLWIGADRAVTAVIDEAETWHTARLYEDGSWRVTHKDGTTSTGCLVNGLCQD